MMSLYRTGGPLLVEIGPGAYYQTISGDKMFSWFVKFSKCSRLH